MVPLSCLSIYLSVCLSGLRERHHPGHGAGGIHQRRAAPRRYGKSGERPSGSRRLPSKWALEDGECASGPIDDAFYWGVFVVFLF